MGTLDGVRDYKRLVDEARQAGLLERRRWYYTLKVIITVGCFALGWVLFFIIGDSWATLGVAALLAFASTQVVYLGHDAGHQEIARTTRMNRAIGLCVGNALSGLSFGWWVPKHNAHHAFPNQLGRDPDLGDGVVGFTVVEARGQSARAVRVRARLEAWIFLPVLLLQGLGLKVTSIRFLGKGRRWARPEGLLLYAHVVFYLVAVLWVLSPAKAVVFVLVHQGLFGLYLGCTFAPNHKGMPIFETDEDLDFVQRQVLTARNLPGGRLITLLFGGLNLQIEHHLFPTMPRPNLRKATGIVRRFCLEQGLAYRQQSLLAAYRETFRPPKAGRGGVPLSIGSALP